MKHMKQFKIKYTEDGKTFTVRAKGRNSDEIHSIFARIFPKAKIVSVERAV